MHREEDVKSYSDWISELDAEELAKDPSKAESLKFRKLIREKIEEGARDYHKISEELEDSGTVPTSASQVSFNGLKIAKVLKFFGSTWVFLVIILNLIAIIGAFNGPQSYWEAVATIQGWYRPFNLLTWSLNLLLLSPAILFFWIARKKEMD